MIKNNYLLLFLFPLLLVQSGCNRERTLLNRTIKGEVTDYFDGNTVEGVTVELYYDFRGTTLVGSPQILPPELVETTVTDNKGKFKFKHKPYSKKIQEERLVYPGDQTYNYLLVFTKEGTDYYRQEYIIDNEYKCKNKIEYKLRPYVEFEFKFYSVNNKADSVLCYANLTSPYPYDTVYSGGAKGIDIDTTFTLKSEFITQLTLRYAALYSKPLYQNIYVGFNESVSITQKKYYYEIEY